MGKIATNETTGKGKRHRGHGQGTIIERVDRKGHTHFRAQVLVEGKRLGKTFDDREEAKKWLHSIVVQADENRLPKDGGKATVRTFLETWLGIKKASVKPRTHELYTYATTRHVLPTLGKLKLAELRPDQLEGLYLKLGETLSPRTVQIVHRVIHGALKDAVRKGLVARNVADAVNAPKPRRKELMVWTPEQATTFLKATADERLGPAYTVLLYCGLRLGELLALRWDDVDLKAGRLQVRRTIQRLKGGQGLVVGEPKSARGRRQIVLSAPVAEAFRRRRVAQKEERLFAGERWKESGYIFTTTVGTPMEQSNFNHYFDRRTVQLGLPQIRVHDLRHTCATMLLAKGVHPKIVQELLGHGQIGLTLDTYSDVLPTMQEEAARTLEAILAG